MMQLLGTTEGGTRKIVISFGWHKPQNNVDHNHVLTMFVIDNINLSSLKQKFNINNKGNGIT